MEKKKASSKNDAGLTGCLHVEECKQIHIPLPAQNIKSKWVKYFNIKPDTLILEQKIGNNLELIDTEGNFLNKTLIPQALSSTINQWDLMKPKSFYKQKDSIIGQTVDNRFGKRYSLTKC